VSHKFLVGLAVEAVVIALAWALVRRRREHRPFAVFATAMLAVDLTRLAIMSSCPWIMSPGPFSGFRRALFHVDQALFNAWPVGVAILSWVVYLGRRPWAPLLAGVLIEGALTLGYPYPFRGATLGRAYALTHGAALVASIFAVLGWARHRAPLRPERGAALLVILLDLAYFAGPYALPEPWTAWADGETVALVMWGGLLALHAGALWDDFLMLPEPPGARRSH
jgi:hypothetical protein